MKNLFYLFAVAFATLMISCGGGAPKAAVDAEAALIDAVEVVKCCETKCATAEECATKCGETCTCQKEGCGKDDAAKNCTAECTADTHSAECKTKHEECHKAATDVVDVKVAK